MLVGRGAQAKLPAAPLVASCSPTVSVLLAFPARPAEILGRKRSSIKCSAFRATVYRFSPQMFVWRLLVTYIPVGPAVPVKGHSCIAPLQLCPHHVVIVVLG